MKPREFPSDVALYPPTPGRLIKIGHTEAWGMQREWTGTEIEQSHVDLCDTLHLFGCCVCCQFEREHREPPGNSGWTDGIWAIGGREGGLPPSPRTRHLPSSAVWAKGGGIRRSSMREH